LPIAREILENNGASISVESAIGTGTTFKILF
jgi:signal transduction histidine kinase